MNALEQSAIDRRERLKKYRQQVQKLESQENGENDENKTSNGTIDEIIGFEEEVQGPMLRLRNYKPHDEQFKDKVEEAKRPEKIEKQIKSQLAGNDNEADNDEIGLETLRKSGKSYENK